MSRLNNPARTGAAGLKLIKRFEGLRLRAYRCPAGKWTVGYGSTAGVKKGDLITTDEAEEMLQRDLRFFEHGVNKAVTVKIKQNQFDALVSLAYNIGLGNFQKSTVLRKLNEGDDYGAGQAFIMWHKITNPKTGRKEVSAGLLRRRRAERELFYGNFNAPELVA